MHMDVKQNEYIGMAAHSIYTQAHKQITRARMESLVQSRTRSFNQFWNRAGNTGDVRQTIL